jgi:molybdopterin-guanine dinucleotide biosynthesis protein
VEEIDSQPELYSIVFQTMDDVNLQAINQLQADLQKNDYHPLDRNDTPAFLKVLVHQLSSDSRFSESGIPENWRNGNRLLLYMDPVYIMRKRLDGTLKAIEQIIENVSETGYIPAPIREIVSGGKVELPDDDDEETLEEQLAAVGGESGDVLLSKEANKEQLEIAKRIEKYNAVLVQGPPGTGKTHTIANLMGHFLAQGKSVLVTSHTPKALHVLKDKVAPGLQNLCVSVLEDSNVDMERSIDGITDFMSRTTSHEIKKEMDKIAQERRQIISDLADVRRKIFRIINQECNCIVYNGEEISPSKAAAFVLEHAEDLSYIPGRVHLDSPLPMSFSELLELYRSNESITAEDEVELSK